jgi:hypothetical protein
MKAGARYSFALKRAKKKNAVPKWVDRRELIKVYVECPKGMRVDHVIPLGGELVSGLHVANNLQYLPDDKNQAKANIFEPSIQINERAETKSS